MAVPDRRAFSPELIPSNAHGIPNKYGHHRYDNPVYKAEVDGKPVAVFKRDSVDSPYTIRHLDQERVRRGFLADSKRMLNNLGSEEKQLLLRNLLSAIRVINKETLFPELKQMIRKTINHVDRNNPLTPQAIKAELLRAINDRHVRLVRVANLRWLIGTTVLMIPKLPHTENTAELVRATFYESIAKLRQREAASAEPLRQQVDILVTHLLPDPINRG